MKILSIACAIATMGLVSALHAAPGEVVVTSTKADHAESLQKAQDRTQVIEIAQATQAASSPPNGAPSLNETYQDWRVVCAQQEAIKRCAISQTQVQKNSQRVLAIELGGPINDTVTGVLVLPFGLALNSGVLLQIDGKPVGQTLLFQTCLPVGCIVPVNFDGPTIAILRTGKAIQVMARTNGGQEVPFTISLEGFAVALDRISVLVR